MPLPSTGSRAISFKMNWTNYNCHFHKLIGKCYRTFGSAMFQWKRTKGPTTTITTGISLTPRQALPNWRDLPRSSLTWATHFQSSTLTPFSSERTVIELMSSRRWSREQKARPTQTGSIFTISTLTTATPIVRPKWTCLLLVPEESGSTRTSTPVAKCACRCWGHGEAMLARTGTQRYRRYFRCSSRLRRS